jgi:predicted ABC-class ATPase
MSYDGDKIEAMASLAALACTTETGYRLRSAIVTDGLITRVLRESLDNPSEMRDIAKSMTRDAILDVANREMAQLDDDEREGLADAVLDEFKNKITVAVRHAWTVCDMLEYPPERLDPEVVAFVAAVYTIPFDASTADDDS